ASASNTASTKTSTSKSATKTQASAPAPGGGNGRVWVNTDSKVYHYSGTRYYGKTKDGKYMSESDAVKAGYQAAKNEKPQ
ncbi:MAG: hypothetical protein WA875_12450, partial [Candidatus Acidiferrales bacterium]